MKTINGCFLLIGIFCLLSCAKNESEYKPACVPIPDIQIALLSDTLLQGQKVKGTIVLSDTNALRDPDGSFAIEAHILVNGRYIHSKRGFATFELGTDSLGTSGNGHAFIEQYVHCEFSFPHPTDIGDVTISKYVPYWVRPVK